MTTAPTARSTGPALRPLPESGRRRVVIEGVSPCVDGGRFPVKRVRGEAVRVEADAFTDGHDALRCRLHHRPAGERTWQEVEMTPLVNDRWQGEFVVSRTGGHEYFLTASVDRFATWRRDLRRKHEAGQEVDVELQAGAEMIRAVAGGAHDPDATRELEAAATALARGAPAADRLERALDDRLAVLMDVHAPRPFETETAVYRITVDRPRARFSTWYEMFPRSASPDPARHGTFGDVMERLPYVAEMGFDVLYLPPIHPIGRSHRKGPNNTLRAGPEDLGSPWAIGGPEGGHKAIHPRLGTLDDFDALVATARGHGVEIALDLAYQCSPDHPYVREHPQWFRHRPDGRIQYAENPPKKYQDIYPFDFECDDWEALWEELKSVVEFWMDHGVRTFRVDNPHTKPFPFWEWLIGEIRQVDPEVIFLSEAFTRPKVMYRLAKLGFTQSYTYFAWRNEPGEIRRYFTELTQTGVVEFMRPNAWPNTPDILTEYLQGGGRAGSVIRLVLAATLTASYGIYGPPFELLEARPREIGGEEYVDSEKYQRRVWDLDRAGSLRELIALVNRLRRDNPALQQDRTLCFHDVDNPRMVCYSKTAPGGEDAIVCVVSTNPVHAETGNVRLDLGRLGLDEHQPYHMHDLLTGARYPWRGPGGAVILDPAVLPAHVFRVRRHVRTEHDFEYYL